jgi:hypothetical protein
MIMVSPLVVGRYVMKDFIAAHQQHIDGVLGCFDRLIFRGYLPLQDGYSMAQFLNRNDVRFRHLKSFLFDQARRIKSHAQAYAEQEGRPFEYLTTRTRMETRAREWIEHDHIDTGLVGIFSVLEPCRSFSFRFEKGRPFVQSARRKCLVLYYYFLDERFGLVHVKVQTWFPMVIQIYVNGHEWLARKLDANDVGYSRIDNVFTHIDDVDRAQAFSDRFTSLDWPKILEAYAHRSTRSSTICSTATPTTVRHRWRTTPAARCWQPLPGTALTAACR